MASATSSFPVPDSPSTSTVISEGATRSSMAKTSRILSERPRSLPNRLRVETGTSTSSSRSEKSRLSPPREIVSPGVSQASAILVVPIQVPFLDWRSMIR